MGFNIDNVYNLKVYLTPYGKEKLYDGGLQNTITHFSLGDSETYYSGSTKYIVDQRGDVDQNVVKNDATLEASLLSMPVIIPKYPDVELNTNLTLSALKISNGSRYFNLGLTNRPYYPIVVSSTAMTSNIFGLNFTHEGSGTGYIDIEEPTFSAVTSGSPFVGVSVTEPQYSESEYQTFFIFNKSSSTLYWEDVFMFNINPVSHFIHTTNVNIPTTGDVAYITFRIGWTKGSNTLASDSFVDGDLTLEIPKNYFTFNRQLALFPFQIIKFRVKYNVVAPGSPNAHYHGQSFSNPNKKDGELNFLLRFVAYDDSDRLNNNRNQVLEDVGVVVQTKDTGYSPDNEQPIEI